MASADANAAFNLHRLDSAVDAALDAVVQLRRHGDLSDLSDSVAGMLAGDLETAQKRIRWLVAARARRGAA
jgi:hypothetical protein